MQALRPGAANSLSRVARRQARERQPGRREPGAPKRRYGGKEGGLPSLPDAAFEVWNDDPLVGGGDARLSRAQRDSTVALRPRPYRIAADLHAVEYPPPIYNIYTPKWLKPSLCCAVRSRRHVRRAASGDGRHSRCTTVRAATRTYVQLCSGGAA